MGWEGQQEAEDAKRPKPPTGEEKAPKEEPYVSPHASGKSQKDGKALNYFGGSDRELEAIRSRTEGERAGSAEERGTGLDYLDQAVGGAQGIGRSAGGDYRTSNVDYRNATDMASGNAERPGITSDRFAQAADAVDRGSYTPRGDYRSTGDYGVKGDYGTQYADSFQKTDAARMQQDLDAAKRASVGAARSVGGGGALRTALMAGAQANAQAAQAGQIVRAQEANQMLSADMQSRIAGDQVRLAAAESGDRARLAATATGDQARLAGSQAYDSARLGYLTGEGQTGAAAASSTQGYQQNVLQGREAARGAQISANQDVGQLGSNRTQISQDREKAYLDASMGVDASQLSAANEWQARRSGQYESKMESRRRPALSWIL